MSNQDLLSSPAPAVPVPGPAATSLVSKMWFVSSYGGFHKWWYPNSWMVYNGKSENNMDDLGVPPFQETSRCVFINVYVLTVHKSCPTKTRFNGQRAMALICPNDLFGSLLLYPSVCPRIQRNMGRRIKGLFMNIE